MRVQTNGYEMASLDEQLLTETFELLTHPYRRYVLYCLANDSSEVGIGTLAAKIATWEGAKMGTDQRTTDTNIRTALRHNHIPKLAEAGIITVDATTNTIELRDTTGVSQFLSDTATIDGYGQTVADD